MSYDALNAPMNLSDREQEGEHGEVPEIFAPLPTCGALHPELGKRCERHPGHAGCHALRAFMNCWNENGVLS